jgi:hypothetical protein
MDKQPLKKLIAEELLYELSDEEIDALNEDELEAMFGALYDDEERLRLMLKPLAGGFTGD